MLQHDLQLRTSNVQLLSDLNGIATFFGSLGYEVSRLPQSLDALGISNATLRANVRQIERIVSYEAELEIYFVELKSVTVANTQALARAFKDLNAEFLLVLTDDYNRIDFVLLERLRSEAGKTSLSVRPRVLTVDRRDPGPQALRVLRRFSFTEPDPFAQYDKLLSAYTVAEWSAIYYNNRALFSDYYLNERLRDTAEWKAAEGQIAQPFHSAQPLLIGAREKLAGKGEQTAFNSLYKPLLALMGFRAEAGKSDKDHLTEPDFRLYTGQEGKPAALMLAYAWNRNLDTTDPARDPDHASEVPGTKVVTLLDAGEADWAIVTNGKLWRLYSAKAHSRATNYYEVDLEEALAGESTLDGQDRSMAFLYWWLFFRAEAFALHEIVRDGKPHTLSFLDRVMEGSEDYAKSLGERLKNRVFEKIFPHFAEGFITALRATQKTQSQDDLELVFQATLTLLYRLMFLLYAEARDLLPIQETRGYYEISLKRLKEEVAEAGGNIEDLAGEKLRKRFSKSDTGFYTRLQALFAVIDRGDPAYNMPQYNGGLFVTGASDIAAMPESIERQVAQFLLDTPMGDQFLAIGLDLLARADDEKTKQLVFVDFKSLTVRQLGSIYEGLLEFKVAVAPEKMAIIEEDKTEKIVPYAEAKKRKGIKIKTAGRGKDAAELTLATGTVYLINTKQERKASGSYYTPDYIVKYIVQHTVGPVLDEKFKALTPRLREAGKKYYESRKRYDGFVKSGMKGDDPEKVWNDDDMRRLAHDVFDLKVLDPAMGSGHFLVEVVDYATDRIIKFLQGFPTNPVAAALRQTRSDILDNLAKQNVSVDPGRLNDVALLKRQVLKRCVYGVDLNPMAVELAKVSLWLDAFTLGAPLSFLDHHLKCGNSLIGTRIKEVQDALDRPGQLSLLAQSQFTGLMLATDLMAQVGDLPDVTVEQSVRSKNVYKEAYKALEPFKRILDVYTSRWFGNTATKGKGKNAQTYEPAIEFLRRDDAQPWIKDPLAVRFSHDDYMKAGQIAQIGLTAAKEKHFFHWELEFPEVFFTSMTSGVLGHNQEDTGFDALVGNPPYLATVTLRQVDSTIWQYYKETFQSASSGKFDLYLPFLEKAWYLIRADIGQASFILPNKWIRSDAGNEIRELFVENTVIEAILDFGGLQVFRAVGTENGPTTYTCVCTLSKTHKEYLKYAQVDDLDLRSPLWHHVNYANLNATSWITGTGFWDRLSQEHVTPLANIATIFVGTTTNADPIFILQKLSEAEDKITVYSEQDKGLLEIESSICIPFLRGKDIGRFEITNPDLVILFPYKQGENSAKLLDVQTLTRQFPLAWQYLNRHKEKLEARENQKWQDKPDWYCHAYPRNYGFIALPKLLTPDVCNRGQATIDEAGKYHVLNTVYGLTSNSSDVSLEYITCLINSRVFENYMRSNSVDLRGGYYRVTKTFMEPFPVPVLTFRTAAVRRTQLSEKGRKLYERCLREGHACVLEFVDHHNTAGETDVIHDMLTFLAQQMIDLNKQKHTEMKRFLDWFEATIKIRPSGDKSGWDVLAGKTDVLEYLGDYQKAQPEKTFQQILDRLLQNRTKLAADVSDPDLKKRLEAEYEKSLSVLRPLKAQLATTDALIDQVVYRLYRLTEDEIKIVEER